MQQFVTVAIDIKIIPIGEKIMIAIGGSMEMDFKTIAIDMFPHSHMRHMLNHYDRAMATNFLYVAIVLEPFP